MKKFFVSLLVLCLAFCALSFTACEETSQSTPEPPPAETPQPEQETEEVEELEHTVTTEISLMGNTWGLLMSEFYGNQIQKEVFLDVRDGSGQCFEYGYNKDGDLETFAWNETYNLYVSKSENLLFTLEQGENGIFTGLTAENDVSVTIELHENGAIKKRELLFGDPSEDGYIVGVEFDEKNRRLTGYTTYSDDTYLMCRYAYENNSIYSTSCTMTVMDNGDDMFNGQCTFTRENGFLTNLYIANEELNCVFDYLPNGNFSSSIATYYNNGIVWQKNSIAFTYSDTGLVSQVIKKNYHSKTQIETEFICNYNEKGLITNSEYITYQNGGIISKLTTDNEYNSNGKITKSTRKTMEYITNAFVLKETTVTQYGSNGEVLSSITYDANGNIINEE